MIKNVLNSLTAIIVAHSLDFTTVRQHLSLNQRRNNSWFQLAIVLTFSEDLLSL